ncbi:hypothetical protein AAJP47_12595 [Psychrobacter sp. B38]|uniref:hypothetical protein n=1 Tax=Psychrobacter sp. B38 TaxID=3143538 RepID=UPI00320CBA47
MDEYSHLMDIDEVIEYLNKNTERKFDQGKVIKFIEQRNIPVVFEYEGWGTWNFRNKGEYQSLNIKLKGYFNIQYVIYARKLFRGSLNNISLGEARIYRLDSHYINANELNRIRHNPLDGLEPKEGDHILFETGGRAPIFAYQKFIDVYTNKATIFEEDSSKSKGKVGVLKVDLEEHLKKKDIEAMENETKMETSSSKIEKLESENEKLKSENASLIQQLEELAIANSLIKQKEQDINELKEKLRSHLEEPTKDKQLTYKSQMTVARMLYAILVEHKYDLSAPKGKTNQLIEIASQSHGTSVSRNFISEWIKLANQAKNDSIK